MRIFATSDLHWGLNPRADQATRRMARYLEHKALKQDVLLLLGDYGNKDAQVRKCLENFQSFPGQILAIAGNHDIWLTNGCYQSSNGRHKAFMEMVAAMGMHPLEAAPVVINGIGFAGTIGWYDYSFADLPGVPLENYEQKLFPGDTAPIWNDALFARWESSDNDMAARFAQRLKQQLQRLRKVKQVVVAMHHLPTKKLLVRPRFLVPRDWRFANTFLGSSQYLPMIKSSHTGVSHILCGHLHDTRQTRDKGISCVTIGSGETSRNLLIIDKNTLQQTTFLPDGS